MTDRTCVIEGCEKRQHSRGWCPTHHSRWWRHGDPAVVLSSGTKSPRPGPASPNWLGDAAGYAAVHRRLDRARGAAAGHTCGCGSPAAEWAYDHTDPDERTETRVRQGQNVELTYSVDPDHYLPMCIPCHRRFDHG